MSSIVIAGDTSGSVTLQAPAIAGSTVITLPSTSTTLVSSQWTTASSDIYYNTGNVGIGTSSPSAKLHAYSTTAAIVGKFDSNQSGGATIGIYGSGTINGYFGTSGNWLGTSATDIAIIAETSKAVTFFTGGSATERARIDTSGRLLIGSTTSSDSSSKLQVGYGYMSLGFCVGSKTNAGNTGNMAQIATNGWLLNNGDPYSANVVSECTTAESSGSLPMLVMNRTASNGEAIRFSRAGTTVGNITIGTSSTSYVTSSDYRLKNTIAPMTGALAKVAQLKPVTYKWNSDGSNSQGFIAHELAEIVPECVTGKKDETVIERYQISPAVEAAFDNQGNELTPAVQAVMGERVVPVYQGIDTSFLVATLTSAIQEQQALITALTQRITALEGN